MNTDPRLLFTTIGLFLSMLANFILGISLERVSTGLKAQERSTSLCAERYHEFLPKLEAAFWNEYSRTVKPIIHAVRVRENHPDVPQGNVAQRLNGERVMLFPIEAEEVLRAEDRLKTAYVVLAKAFERETK